MNPPPRQADEGSCCRYGVEKDGYADVVGEIRGSGIWNVFMIISDWWIDLDVRTGSEDGDLA